MPERAPSSPPTAGPDAVVRQTARTAGAICAVVLAVPAAAGARPSVSATPALFPNFRPGVTDYVSRCRLGHGLRIKERGRVHRYRLREGQGVRVRLKGRTYHVRCLPRD